MPAVVALRPHAKEDANSYVGITVALASWAMMFAGIFFAYAVVRASSAEWPPLGAPRLPVRLPLVSTAVIVASSVAIQLGIRDLRAGRVERFTRWLAATMVLGVAFLELQYVLWTRVGDLGLHMDSGIYGSVFYALTYVHAAHIVAGLLAFVWILVRALRGTYTAHNYFPVRSVALFWHFVDAVWIVMFVTVFVL